MAYENEELKHADCDFCGHNMKCFLQYEYGAAHAVCPECLRTADCIAEWD